MKNYRLTRAKEMFLYYTCCVIIFSIIFYSYIGGGSLASSFDLAGWAYFVTGALSQAALFALAPVALSLPALLLCKRRAPFAVTLVASSTLLTIFFIANQMVYALYRFHINGFVMDMLFGGAAGDIFQFDTVLYVKVVAIVLFIIAVMIGVWHLCRLFVRKFNYAATVPVISVLLAATLFAHLFHAYAEAVRIPSVTRGAAAIPYNAPLTANTLMRKLGVVSKEAATVNLRGGEGSGINYPLSEIVSEGDSARKNIVLLLIDSWNPRAWTPEVFPHISDFAGRCSAYTNHLSSGNRTIESIIGMFYGLPSCYRDILDASGTQPVMVERLLAEGYDVKPYSSATLVYPPFGRMLFSGVPNLRVESEGETVYERDCAITNEFIDYLNEEHEKPFFAFLFYDLAHGCELPAERNRPFAPAWDYPDYLALNNSTDAEPFWNLYRNSLFQVDLLVARVLDTLEERDMLRNTMVIITGDHGQEFNENKKNYWGHGSNYSPAQLRVPMLVFDADKEICTYTHRTTHYDISTTILKDYLGVKNPEEELGIGYRMDDKRSRDWHFVGNGNKFAFVIDENMNIVEKKHRGHIEVFDSLINPIDDFKYDVVKFNNRILDMNRFYKD